MVTSRTLTQDGRRLGTRGLPRNQLHRGIVCRKRPMDLARNRFPGFPFLVQTGATPQVSVCEPWGSGPSRRLVAPSSTGARVPLWFPLGPSHVSTGLIRPRLPAGAGGLLIPPSCRGTSPSSLLAASPPFVHRLFISVLRHEPGGPEGRRSAAQETGPHVLPRHNRGGVKMPTTLRPPWMRSRDAGAALEAVPGENRKEGGSGAAQPVHKHGTAAETKGQRRQT